MKLAVIADIHANIRALDAVFADMDTEEADQGICLGDLVGCSLSK